MSCNTVRALICVVVFEQNVWIIARVFQVQIPSNEFDTTGLHSRRYIRVSTAEPGHGILLACKVGACGQSVSIPTQVFGAILDDARQDLGSLCKRDLSVLESLIDGKRYCSVSRAADRGDAIAAGNACHN